MVWGLGGDGMSNQHTSRIIGPFMDWLIPDLSWQEKRAVFYWMRKSAHVFEYAMLALLTLRALWLSWRESLLLTSVFAVGVVVAMAIADETRQGRSAMRTGSGWDVLLDIAGGVTAIAGFLLIARLRRGSRPLDPALSARPAGASDAEEAS
jgi:VanZ family protein